MNVFVSITNILLLILWTAVWRKLSSDTFFNPYTTRIYLLSERVSTFLQPVLPWFSSKLRALSALLFLLLFRGFLIYRASGTFMISIHKAVDQKPLFSATFDIDKISEAVSYSFLSFAWMLLSIAVISLIYRALNQNRKISVIQQTLNELSGPGAYAPMPIRVVHIAVYGFILVYLLYALSATGGLLPEKSATPLTARILLTTLAAMVESLSILYSILIGAIVASFTGAFSQRKDLIITAQEIIRFLIGPVSKWAPKFGTFDLSPIIFFVVLALIQAFLFGNIYLILNSLK